MVRSRARAVAKRPRLAISIAVAPLIMGLAAAAAMAIARRRTKIVKMMNRVTPGIAHRRRRLVQGVRGRLGRTRSRSTRTAQPTSS
jgi:hypothetical protein